MSEWVGVGMVAHCPSGAWAARPWCECVCVCARLAARVYVGEWLAVSFSMMHNTPS